MVLTSAVIKLSRKLTLILTLTFRSVICRGKTIVKCSRGAKIKDIHKKANEFLASGHIDGNTALR